MRGRQAPLLGCAPAGILCLLGKWQRQLVRVWVSFGTVITPCEMGEHRKMGRLWKQLDKGGGQAWGGMHGV